MLIFDLFLFVAGIYFSVFNKQFTLYKINQKRKWCNKRNIHTHDSLFNSKSYLLRQRIKYLAVGIMFIIAAIYGVLFYFLGEIEILKNIFFILLIVIGLIVVVSYQWIKSKDNHAKRKK